MAKYRQLIVEGDTGWHLMSPTNAWEALRLAWLLWRHPDRVAALVGVKQEYTLEHWRPRPKCDEFAVSKARLETAEAALDSARQPLHAEMMRLNKRVIDLTAELDRVRAG
jgi:hypothetical protein